MSQKRKRATSASTDEYDFEFVGEDDSRFFNERYGRRMNTMNKRYTLPVDGDEIKRSEFHHRLVNWVFGGKNYVGPVKELLDNRQRKEKRVLDVGTGGGIWAIEMADEFSDIEVTGVDLAPIQPRFELCDLDQYIPYPSNHFDVVHARSMHHGIKNYQRFVDELRRILRPGGILLIIEPDTDPVLNGRFSSDIERANIPTNIPGWHKLWMVYRGCLAAKGIDVAVPRSFRRLLQNTRAFEKIVTQLTDVPIGFWPQGKFTLTIGQLAWMEYDLLLPAMEPLLMEASCRTQAQVKELIENAQQDLYYPQENISCAIEVDGAAIIIAEIILVLYAGFRYDYRRGLDKILMLLIGGIPIAMPTVLSVAVCAQRLAKNKAIVTRITAIEELAVITILCSDKTDTLTTNKLTIDRNTHKTYGPFSAEDVILLAAYASRTENQDTIDLSVVQTIGEVTRARASIKLLDFNPVDKRTEITYREESPGKLKRITKGMNGIIAELCTRNQTKQFKNRLEADVEKYATRSLTGGQWFGIELIVLLAIFDPPREDTKQTIDDMLALGIEVKMVTSDQLAIAKETGYCLGLSDHMYPAKMLKNGPAPGGKHASLNETVLDADGFAGVFPKHKYKVIKCLRDLDHLRNKR
ncbi:hypothetical protein HWV62_18946 [Athelia sp. TMB]|nr:hypothetical protein HWV62_18946 [Athelia sp. TMB]